MSRSVSFRRKQVVAVNYYSRILLAERKQDMKATKLWVMMPAVLLAMVTTGATVQAADQTTADGGVAASVDVIARETVARTLGEQEKFKGRALLLPDVSALLGVLRWAERAGDAAAIERVKRLYATAYLNGVNTLTYGGLEDHVTAVVPMELYRLTGDTSLLRRAQMVVEGQRLHATPKGLYRFRRDIPNDDFVIAAVQGGGFLTFGDKAALEFCA